MNSENSLYPSNFEYCNSAESFLSNKVNSEILLRLILSSFPFVENSLGNLCIKHFGTILPLKFNDNFVTSGCVKNKIRFNPINNINHSMFIVSLLRGIGITFEFNTTSVLSFIVAVFRHKNLLYKYDSFNLNNSLVFCILEVLHPNINTHLKTFYKVEKPSLQLELALK